MKTNVYRFGQLFEIIDGDRGKNYPGDNDFSDVGYCLFLNAGNVTKTGWSFETNAFITKEKDEQLRKGRVKRGDTVLTTRGTVGNAAYYDERVPYDHLRINSGMVILSAKDNTVVDNEYIYYLVTSPIAKKTIELFCSGSAQPQLPIKDFVKIKFNLPAIDKQKRIVSILSAYDNLIEVNNKRIKVLEQMAENLYKEWFVRFRFPGHEIAEFENGIPKGWKITRLGSVANISTGKSNRQDAEEDGAFPFFDRSQEVKRSNIWLKDCEGIIVPGEGTTFYPRYYQGKFDLHQRCYCVEPKEESTGKFLFYVIKMNRHYFLSVATGATVPSLRLNNFLSMKFVMPSFDVCKAFDSVVTNLFFLIDKYKIEKEALVKQRDLLLPRLMSGKLEV